MANRYWVNGTGTWTNASTTNWSTSSGGAPGASVPTAADVAIFDINSNASGGDLAYTCTKPATGSVLGIVIGPTFSGNAVTLAGSGSTTVLSSGLAVAATVNWTLSGAVTFGASTTVCESSTTVIASPIIIGTGFSVTLSNDFRTSSTITCTTTGIINPNNFNCQCSNIDFGSTTGRTIAFGATGRFTFTITGASVICPTNTSAAITATGTPNLYFAGNATTGIRYYNPIFGSRTNVFVTAGSGTCQIGLWTGAINNLTFSEYTGGMASNNFLIVGNLTLSSGMTVTGGTISLTGVGVTQTIASNGSSLSGLVLSMTGGGTAVLADSCAVTANASSNVTLNSGTLNLNGFTLSTRIFSSSNTNTRSIAFGSGTIALAGSGTVLNMATATGFSFTGTSNFTRNQAATATVTFGTTGGSTTNAPNLTVNAGASALTISGWYRSVNFTGSTCTVSGSFNFAGTSVTLDPGGTYTGLSFFTFNPCQLFSNGRTLGSITANSGNFQINGALTLNSTSTFTLSSGTLILGGTLSTGIFSSNTSTTRAISFGAHSIALTSTTAATTVLSMSTATNFSYTGTPSFTRNQAATATVVFGVTGGTASRAPNLTVNAGASTLTMTFGSYFKNLDFTGSTCTVSAASLNNCGNLTLAAGGDYSLVATNWIASGTITSLDKPLNNIQINGSGITVTLAGELRGFTNTSLILTQGTFDAAGFNVRVGLFDGTGSVSFVKTLNMGSGTWTIAGSGATTWNAPPSANFTINPGTSTITMTSASAKTFVGGGVTYHNLNQGGTGALTISGSNTFNNITNTVQPATVTFTASTTQTVSNFGLSGTAGNLVTINSSTPGSQFTLSDVSGTVDAQYLSIRDSNATGGAIWNALSSTNLGNNTGWIFPGGNMFLMFM